MSNKISKITPKSIRIDFNSHSKRDYNLAVKVAILKNTFFFKAIGIKHVLCSVAFTGNP